MGWVPYGWLTNLVETIIFLDGDDACFATEKKGKVIVWIIHGLAQCNFSRLPWAFSLQSLPT